MNTTTFRVTSEPTTEPLALSDAKAYMRVDFTDDDTVIQQLISSSRKYCEGITGRAFATQSITCQYTIDQPQQGILSGPIDDDQTDFYHYEQQLGANPFGVSQFFFDLPMAPLQSVQTVGTQFTKFYINPDGTPNYTTLPQFATDGITVNWAIDTLREPGRIYFQAPLIVYSWQFLYTAGYDGVTYKLPYDLLQCLRETTNFFYENREAEDVPDGLMTKLLNKRLDWV